MKKVWWWIKCALGAGSIYDGSICWFSKKFYDVHDYHKRKGGDGLPSHFYDYKCSNCGKLFII